MQNQTDEQLVKSYLKGEEQALEILIQRYLSPLYNFVYKYTHDAGQAEDVTQESFIKIWSNLKKFNPQYKFKTWAYTIAKNTALDALKKKGFVAVSNENGEPEDLALSNALVSKELLPEQLMMQVDDAAMVGRTLDKLPSIYREIIDLYYQRQLNFREIAQLLKQSINTVKTRHRRALIYLKKELKDK
jgi:RNA polymerase sigma-70 factor (ECF subfamily)